jgi:hypothetical protein
MVYEEFIDGIKRLGLFLTIVTIRRVDEHA